MRPDILNKPHHLKPVPPRVALTVHGTLGFTGAHEGSPLTVHPVTVQPVTVNRSLFTVHRSPGDRSPGDR
eukprot:362360-Chlamydomonas_euryale.AAC.11